MVFASLVGVVTLTSCDRSEEVVVDDCPETALHDFDTEIRDRQHAAKLFAEYFSEEKGFPSFRHDMLRGPSEGDPSVPDGTYSYFGWYGRASQAGKLGGLLYPDGRLVQRGYCK